MKKFIFILFIILIDYAQAATIYGSIYDLNIEKIKNSIVEINTNPKQRYVAVNGSYQFEVPLGKYLIIAYHVKDNNEYLAKENLTILDNGIYILDLFSYPVYEDEFYENLDFEIDQPFGENRSIYWLFILLGTVLALFLVLIVQVNKRIIRKELTKEIEIIGDDLNKIMQLLKTHGGRMTQKEIRKKISLSEAKISLMISELEDLGKVKKIKKGRGNIIILK